MLMLFRKEVLEAKRASWPGGFRWCSWISWGIGWFVGAAIYENFIA
jgi:hypothetical protein